MLFCYRAVWGVELKSEPVDSGSVLFCLGKWPVIANNLLAIKWKYLELVHLLHIDYVVSDGETRSCSRWYSAFQWWRWWSTAWWAWTQRRRARQMASTWRLLAWWPWWQLLNQMTTVALTLWCYCPDCHLWICCCFCSVRRVRSMHLRAAVCLFVCQDICCRNLTSGLFVSA